MKRSPQSGSATLSAGFGVLAALLAGMGMYGVMAFTVARRTREIGLRMALGAQRTQIVNMVMREAAVVVAVGLLIGIPVAWIASGEITSQLFGMKGITPAAVAAAAAILAATALGAGFLPSKRASSMDPMDALHYE